MPTITINTNNGGDAHFEDDSGRRVTELDNGDIAIFVVEPSDGYEVVSVASNNAMFDGNTLMMGDFDVVVDVVFQEEVEIFIDVAAIAEAGNQHFWTDDGGAHVTDVSREDFEEAETQGFPDLSDSNPYNNLLMNSLGILLRSAGNVMAGFTRSAVSFFDGLGNAPNNIAAMFGRDRARVGNSGGMHTDITAGSISMLNGTDRLMRIGGDLTGNTKPYHVYGTSQLDSEAYHIGMSVVEGEEVYQLPGEPAYAYVDAPIDEPAPELWVRSDYADNPTSFIRIDDLMEMMGDSFADVYRYDAQVMEGGGVNRHVYQFSHVNGTSEEAVTNWQIRSTYPERLPMTAIGEGCIASSPNQTVLGRYNIIDTQNRYALIVGNGTDDAHRSNALTLDWSGNLSVSGTM